MAITIGFNGSSLRKPGAYSSTSVNLTGGFPLAATGVVALVGEAVGGEAGVVATYTSEDMAALISAYKSGPIVDAAKLLTSPARDNRVPNGASQIKVYKTNAGTKASRTLATSAPADLLTITSRNWGADENLVGIKVTAGSTSNQVVFTVTKGDVSETLTENAAQALLSIQYEGADTSCTYEIDDVSGVKTLTLTTGETTADDLAISLVGKTIQDVVDLVHNHGGTAGAVYSASTSYVYATSKSAEDLDYVPTAADVKTSAVTLYGLQKEIEDIINTESSLVTATLIAGVAGIPAATSKLFLTGGTLGASSNTTFQSGFDALLSHRCNTVVPLVSRDATALISEGVTDPSSSWTASAVNLQAVTHCVTASNTKNRSERNCYVSLKGSFASTKTAAQTLGHERASMLFQDVMVLDAAGDLVQKEPWAAASMLAGIQAGTPVGTPATFKIINALGIEHQDYNAKTQIDQAIDAGLLPLEEAPAGGIRVVVHNTTYGRDANFVYNRVSVLEAADYVAYNLRQQLEAIFVGSKTTSTLAVDVRDTIVSIMASFLNAQILVGDDSNNGLGFKDLVVSVSGNVVYIDVTVTPVQGVDFILPRLVLDTIRQSA